MVILAMMTLAVALAASAWTIAYALHEPLADLLWLHRLRQWDAWWNTIEDMHTQLDALVAADNLELLGSVAA
jgi:hypothetical protein